MPPNTYLSYIWRHFPKSSWRHFTGIIVVCIKMKSVSWHKKALSVQAVSFLTPCVYQRVRNVSLSENLAWFVVCYLRLKIRPFAILPTSCRSIYIWHCVQIMNFEQAYARRISNKIILVFGLRSWNKGGFHGLIFL